MRRLLSVIIVLTSLLALPMSAKAVLDLELTQGMSAALPIAIIPFANSAKAKVPGNTSITAVITKDLTNSGQFRIITPGLTGSKPSTPAQVKARYWQKKGANDILIGNVNKLSSNRYQVSFQLLSLYGKTSAKVSKNKDAALLNSSFIVKKAGLRVLAHHISDVVYQKLTGVRGIFNTKIAYVLLNRNVSNPEKATYRLEVADADGFNPHTLLKQNSPIMSPTWSPSGQQIAYVSFEKNHASIYMQNVATGKRQLVSDYPGVNGAPAFSPNGQRMAMVLTRTGNPKIYVKNLKSGQLTQITKGYSIDTEPFFAPDGKTLLFTSNRGGSPQIYQYSFANKTVQRITFDGNYNARASYLPNDTGIVMMHRGSGMFSIARQNLTSGRLTELTRAGNDESPSVAPNGKMVIYATEYGRRGVLAMVSTDGRVKLRLPAADGSVQEPAWSPFLNII